MNTKEYHKTHYVDTGYMKKYQAEWYQKNKERVLARINERRQEIRRKAREYKLARGCDTCDYNRSPHALHFHHRDGKDDVRYAISAMVQRGCAWATILEHIAKCDLLCANCHMETHADDFGQNYV